MCPKVMALKTTRSEATLAFRIFRIVAVNCLVCSRRRNPVVRSANDVASKVAPWFTLS